MLSIACSIVSIQNLAENHRQVNLPQLSGQMQADYQKINTMYELLCECTKESQS